MKRTLSKAVTALSFGILLTGCVSTDTSYSPYQSEPYYYDSNEYNEFDMGYVTSGGYYPYPDYYPYNYDYTYAFPSPYYSHYRNYHWNNSGGGHFGGHMGGGSMGSFHRR